MGKGKAHVRKMDTILADSRGGNVIKFIPMSVIVKARTCRRRIGRKREVLVTARNCTDNSSKKILGCASTTSNTVLRAVLGMCPLKSVDVRKLKWQYELWSMPKMRLPAIANSAVLEKETKGRAGARRDNVIDEVWKGIGIIQEDPLSMEKSGRYKT